MKHIEAKVSENVLTIGHVSQRPSDRLRPGQLGSYQPHPFRVDIARINTTRGLGPIRDGEVAMRITHTYKIIERQFRFNCFTSFAATSGSNWRIPASRHQVVPRARSPRRRCTDR
ncbi:hypothetical protein [Phytoactinopolyspora mesophila]|uniref:hypothetical protein n=1 Tax=Phytoactinopolyspora mesophila TaxID=2650750 RepID=UPI001390843D|nr:hypothetical protein [Phytoactinopolyspora mesophila]